MKPTGALKIGLLSLVVSMTSYAGALGPVSLGGSGCTTSVGDKKIVAVVGQANRYKIPLQVALNKKMDTNIMRKTCNFRLPVDVAQNQKVVVSNVSQWVRLGASAGAQVKTNLEVFLAGARGNPLTTEIKAIDQSARLFQTVHAEGVVAESKCGQSVVLAGNLSATAIGAANATAAIGDLQLNIKFVSCD